MGKIDIIYVVIGVLVFLNIIVIWIAVKCAYRVDDDFEFIDDNGDHIYYDRKLIAHKREKTRRAIIWKRHKK